VLLTDLTVTIIVVEHKDRFTRFGFKYIETSLAVQGCSIEQVAFSLAASNASTSGYRLAGST
jgi:predicted site-specific integrase-resolvase